jgi:Origin of replication binding protein
LGNGELTPAELAAWVREGKAFCAQVSGSRKAANFLASDVVTVDVDGGMTIEQALKHPIVKNHATLIYTTVNHRPDAHRFRIVFALPRTITSDREMRAIARSLALRLNGDPAAVDATRISFGSRGAQTWVFDRELSVELTDELIAHSVNPPESDVIGIAERVATTRSGLRVRPEQPIRLAADRRLVPLSQVPVRTAIFCPFHQDENPSAFVLVSTAGVKGIHCAACAHTFFCAPADEFDFHDFDREVRRAAEHYENHRDFGPLGPLFNSPSAQIGLIGSNVTIANGTPAPSELLPGVTLVKSEKGSGKTQALKAHVNDANSVLLIGHRRGLISNSCARLGLHCYLDDRPGTLIWSPKVGICLDSILRLGRATSLDLLILDESEQLLAHFLSETLERRQGGGRDRIFNEFRMIVARAKRVVALDADLGWVTYNTLARMRR